MQQTISLTALAARFSKAFQDIRDNVDLLSKLDSATGDGDHGVTMVRIVDKADEAIAAKGTADAAALFKAMGMGALMAGGGSAGPLMGQFFIGMANGAPENPEAMTAVDVAKLFTAGYEGMYKFSKANVGDRTMMDALKPAVDALNADTTCDIDAMLAAASEAATAGAKATEQMLAKFGRARNLGDRVLGHPDPGATSWSIIFKGLTEG